VLLHDGLHGRQLDVLVHADRLSRQVGRQREAAVRTRRRAMVDDPVGILGHDPAVAVMAGRSGPKIPLSEAEWNGSAEG